MSGSLWTELEYVLRIVCAMLCGGLIGLERERRVKSAGLKTHMIVSAGAALMMVVSKYGFWDVLSIETVKLDPSRIAAGIVSAIGFLGAGIIFTRGFKINGVTTAAGLWTTVGIGMTLGAGLYLIGAICTGFILLIQFAFRGLRRGPLRTPINVNLKMVGNRESLRAVRNYLEEHHCHTLKVTLIPMGRPGDLEMDLHVTLADKQYEERLMRVLDREDVKILLLEYEP